MVLKNTRKAVEFTMAWRMVGTVKPPAKVLPVVRNIKLINITGTVNAVGDMHGLAGSPIENVVFKHCSLTAKTGLLLEYVDHVDLSGLKMQVASGEKIIKR